MTYRNSFVQFYHATARGRGARYRVAKTDANAFYASSSRGRAGTCRAPDPTIGAGLALILRRSRCLRWPLRSEWTSWVHSTRYPPGCANPPRISGLRRRRAAHASWDMIECASTARSDADTVVLYVLLVPSVSPHTESTGILSPMAQRRHRRAAVSVFLGTHILD